MRKNKLPNIVTLAIFTTITIFAWIFFDVYRALTEKTDLNIASELLEEVNPSLNTEVLEFIENSNYLSIDEATEFINQASSEQAQPPTPTEVQENIEPEEIEETEIEATESAEEL